MFKLEKGQEKEEKTMRDDIWEFNPVSIHLMQAQCVGHVKCLKECVGGSLRPGKVVGGDIVR